MPKGYLIGYYFWRELGGNEDEEDVKDIRKFIFIQQLNLKEYSYSSLIILKNSGSFEKLISTLRATTQVTVQ